MTLITPIEDIGSAESLLSVAEKQVQRLIGAVEGVLQTNETSQDLDTKEAVALSKDLSKALQTLFEERSRVEKLRKQKSGIVHDFALDFDRARLDIGSRLARLRRANNTGDVSE
ncbi:hypothetical protein AB9F29_13625 [Falsihalocynthiibacter sp. S25ZX9]|uniref:hypothetical protein n=1 Tax=Falsihalocynthiibacter sp. S25ZX9 TaxID=3240870 RepID=UPI00350EE3C6